MIKYTVIYTSLYWSVSVTWREYLEMSSEISLSSEECTSRVLAVCLVFRHVEGEGDLINILVIDSLVLVHQLIILVRGDSLARVGLPSQPEGAHESLTLKDNMLHVTPHTLQVTRYKSHVTCHTSHVTCHTSLYTRQHSVLPWCQCLLEDSTRSFRRSVGPPLFLSWRVFFVL